MHRAHLCDGSGSRKSVEGTDSAMLRRDFFEKSNWGKKFFWSRSILISTDGAQEMQKSSSRFPVRSWILKTSHGVFTDSRRSKQGRVQDPAHSLFFLASRERWFVMALECLKAVVDFIPVDYIPPSRQVFGAAIVVFEVVGVLPNVIAENGEQALGDGVVLVGRADDLHFAAGLSGQPDPSAAELFCAGIVELGLEILEVAECFLDDFGDCAAGIAAALGLHDLPEHGVVHVSASIVA